MPRWIWPWTKPCTRAAIDISGRPFLVWDVAFTAPKIGSFDTELVREFFQALAQHGGITLHVANLYGPTAIILPRRASKAVARVLRTACEVDPRQERPDPFDKGIPWPDPACHSG